MTFQARREPQAILSGLARELRIAARALRRSPVSTATTAITLALGVGAATAAFSAVNGMLLKPLPVVGQDRIAVLWSRHRIRDFPHVPFTWAGYQAARSGVRTLAAAAAVEASGAVPRAADGPEGAPVLSRARVLGDFWGVLGVVPAVGRTSRLDEDVPGAPRVAVISHGLWDRAFGRDPAAVGRSLGLEGTPFTIVGVAPAGFDYPRGTEVWTPLRPYFPDWATDPPPVELDVVARLAPDATREQVTAELTARFEGLPEVRQAFRDLQIEARTLAEVTVGEVRPALLVLLLAGVLVALVAGINVANLLWVRGARQAPAFAVRLALGAGRGVVIRALLAEGILLAVLGGVVGGLLAFLALRGGLPLVPAGLPRIEEVRVDGAAWAFALAVSALVTLAFAALPALAVGRLAAGALLRGMGGVAGRARSGRTGRHVLVVGQVAAATGVLVAAGLLGRSFARITALDPGFRDDDLLAVRLSHPYPHFQVPEGFVSTLDEVIRRLEARPDVESATPALTQPFAGNAGFDVVPTLEGQGPEEASRNPYLNLEVILPGYLATLEVTPIAGRDIRDGDDEGGVPVALVNEAAARALWPGQDAVGKRLNTPFPGMEGVWWTVAGVVGDSRYRELLAPRPSLYLPLRQFRGVAPRQLLVRTRGTGEDVTDAVRLAFDELNPSVRVLGASPMEQLLAGPLAGRRFSALVLGALALTALALASVGMYGVMAWTVSGRTRELGIRMTLGARPGDVSWLVVRHGMTLAGTGAGLGLLVAAASTRFLRSLLYEISASDPAAFGLAAALALGVAALACSVPAVRAMRVDPVHSLRAE